MDPRRLLSAAALSLAASGALGGCAVSRSAAPHPASSTATAVASPSGETPVATPSPPAADGAPFVAPCASEALASRSAGSGTASSVLSSAPAPDPALVAGAGAGTGASEEGTTTLRPYLSDSGVRPAARANVRHRPDPDARVTSAPTGRAAIAAANREARSAASTDAFIGGVRIFGWDPGRVYEVWTAPLRVTALTLAPGEAVTAKAAGDTVRWQIGESISGVGAAVRTHVLIKPLQTGLETNLVLTTSQRVYLLTLRSGAADAFNAAIAWDYAVSSTTPSSLLETSPGALAPTEGPPPVDVAAVTPEGPLDARYRIEPRGRAPRWRPTAVFNDGVRTFIALSPDVAVDETPALFVMTGGDAQLVNYRQADGLLIVDRVFDEAELRLGDRRPRIVRIRRLTGAAR